MAAKWKSGVTALTALVLVLAVTSVALAAGSVAGTYATTVKSPPQIKGKWSLTFADGGSYKVALNGRLLARGTYSATATTITLREPTGNGCADPARTRGSVRARPCGSCAGGRLHVSGARGRLGTSIHRGPLGTRDETQKLRFVHAARKSPPTHSSLWSSAWPRSRAAEATATRPRSRRCRVRRAHTAMRTGPGRCTSSTEVRATSSPTGRSAEVLERVPHLRRDLAPRGACRDPRRGRDQGERHPDRNHDAVLEKYGFDTERLRREGTVAERRLALGPPADVQKAQDGQHAYEDRVCGVAPPPAADVVFESDASSKAYCAALRR